MSKKMFAFLSVLLLFTHANTEVAAEIRAQTLDGKPVILSDDGTWKYAETRKKLIDANISVSNNENLSGDAEENILPFTCKVIGEVTGGYYFDGSTWQPITQDQVFTRAAKIKSSEKYNLEVELPKGNKIKLFNDSIVKILSPMSSKPRGFAQLCNLESGEANFAISLDGRDFLAGRIGDSEVLGHSGLFKIIYDPKSQSGEVVVKNGLVEIRSRKAPDLKHIKVSGFYKSTLENGKFSSPTQASVIQYDWR